MNVKVAIDARAKGFIASLQSAAMSNAIMNVALPIIEKHWQNVVSRELTPRQAAIYSKAMRVSRSRGTTAILSLDPTAPQGTYALLIEKGTDGYDFRDTMLNVGERTGPSSRKVIDQPSRVIAFQHAAYNSATNRFVPMGKPFQYASREGAQMSAKEAKSLGYQIYKEAKLLQPGQAMQPMGLPMLHPHHSHEIYERMYRRPKAPKGKSKYVTFRTLNMESPSAKWHYPSRAPHDLIDKAIDESTDEIFEAIRDIFNGAATTLKLRKKL
jgi:hypothetical protein